VNAASFNAVQFSFFPQLLPLSFFCQRLTRTLVSLELASPLVVFRICRRFLFSLERSPLLHVNRFCFPFLLCPLSLAALVSLCARQFNLFPPLHLEANGRFNETTNQATFLLLFFFSWRATRSVFSAPQQFFFFWHRRPLDEFATILSLPFLPIVQRALPAQLSSPSSSPW